MAIPVRIVLYAPSRETANRSAQAAYARTEALNAILSDYDPASEVSRLSAAAGTGKAVAVSDDLWRVLARAREISDASGGAFDITVRPVVRLWRRARRSHRFSPEQIQEALRLVDYRLVHLDPTHRTATLRKPGMQLDLGGIAKGYIIDEALKVLRQAGVRSALVDAGGDIALGDPPPGRPGWRIGIASLHPGRRPTRYLWLSRVTVATSGDTRQYVLINGTRYSHIVDPRTGVGLTDHSQVTVVAPDGMTADALASAVSVLGPEKGLKLAEAFPGAAARIVRAPAGTVQTHQSKRWKKLPDATPAD